jgi:hypothetical protein
MPTYKFRDVRVGEVNEYIMKISELDAFKARNPHLEQYHTFDSLPGLGDSSRMSVPGIGQPDATFEREVIGRIKKIPGNVVKDRHKHKLPREW